MRIDKFLKVSRLIKRRPLAKQIIDEGRVKVNEIVVKAGYQVKLDDIIEIEYGNRYVKAKVLQIIDSTKKEDAPLMYDILDEYKKEPEQLF
jgi:ribosomal 50S subunit-recycling heat shock protein